MLQNCRDNDKLNNPWKLVFDELSNINSKHFDMREEKQRERTVSLGRLTDSTTERGNHAMKKNLIIGLTLVLSLLYSQACGAIIEGEWKEMMMSDLNLEPLRFEYVPLNEKQMATIYSGPGERYTVIAENVEMSSISLAGMVGGWALIDSDYGVGYVDTSVMLERPKAEQVRFAYIAVTASNDCCMLKNPNRGHWGGYLTIVHEGEELILLAEMDNYVYAEANVEGRLVRGFLSRDDFGIDDWKRELSRAGYFTGYDVDLMELYTHQYAVHKEGSIAAGWGFTVGLKSDGTCIARGRNDYGQCNVEDWQSIVAVCAGFSHTVGLKSDGTVVATGNNGHGECDVENWHGIVAISAGDSHTVGLMADGRVVVTGDNSLGQHELYWTWFEDVVAVSAGSNFTSVLTDEGKVYSSGGNCDPAYGYFLDSNPNYHDIHIHPDWENIVAIGAGGWHIVGICADGTLVAEGETCSGQLDFGDWENVAEVVAADGITYVLLEDGTVRMSYYMNWCLEWGDVVHIAGSDTQIIGVKNDGTLETEMFYRSGYSVDYEEYDVSDWCDIGLPSDAKVFEQ